MKLLGRRDRSRVEPTPEEEYEVLSDEELQLQDQIRDLEGFIEEAPQIKEKRLQETRVTLPPIGEDRVIDQPAVSLEDEEDGEDYLPEDEIQERVGRRHIAAMKRERRKNFFVFLVAAAAVGAFLYWVSLVVQ